MIRISPVRLIAADGEQHGIVPLEKAQTEAADAGLDLVEVAADARPPVVRIMDWGRFQYEQQELDDVANTETRSRGLDGRQLTMVLAPATRAA